jgi:uncharacterized protein (TIGR02996 family)
MKQRAAFLCTIAENLYDDAPRLIFADWLEEHGDPDSAEFIRIQCELEPMRDQYEIDRAAQLHKREDELRWEHQKKWLADMPTGWDEWQTGAAVEFRRGFVDTLSLPVRTFLDLGAEIRRLHPTIRRLVLFRVHGYGERLAVCPILDGLAELELACWYSDADAAAIAASPYLRQLQVLELWLGRYSPLRDSRLCQIMARSKAWPHLRELTLLNPDNEKVPSRKRLVATANKVAGRELAVYRCGYPELFPFAADYWYLFPGFLPDGRMALANRDRRTSSPTLCVLTFDKKGNQTDDVLTLPLPDDLLGIPREEWYDDKDRIKEYLMDTIGFRPGFIRIRDCHFPGDESKFDSPSPEIGSIWGVSLGAPDSDDAQWWEDNSKGIGGEIYHQIHEGDYVLGWDRYADKRGRVHST